MANVARISLRDLQFWGGSLDSATATASDRNGHIVGARNGTVNQ